MKTPAVKEYGRSDLCEKNWGLHPLTSQKLAAILTYYGSLEYYVERAIWKLENFQPKEIRPDTDAKTITHLISKLEKFVATLEEPDDEYFLKSWCEAASFGFIIRNNIAHGVAVKMGNTLAFMRNPCWHGEIRKREFGDFWADKNTLDLVCESLAVLLRIIVKIESGELTIKEIASPIALKALREARSILGEFSSQSYNPSFEKY